MYRKKGEVCPDRLYLLQQGKAFFTRMLEAPAKYVAVENPTPLRIASLPPPTQVIQPYEYGHPYSKRTLLWLRGLPPLVPTEVLETHSPFLPSNTGGAKRGQKHSRGKARCAKEASVTFSGVASAMAEQWTSFMLDALRTPR